MEEPRFKSALLLGLTAGLRSMTAPALLALNQQRTGRGRFWMLASPRTARVLTVMALGELVYDKMPFAGSRLAPQALSARLLMGAMCGAAVSPSDDQAQGALVGMGGALVSSVAGYAIRKGAGRAAGLPDVLLALAEDALAIGMGMAATAMESGEDREFVRHQPGAHVA
jgi:uncharacterized membrane protein